MKNMTWSKALTYARFLLAGGIGGAAVVNTFAQIMSVTPAPTVEHVAMFLGAAALAGAAKVFHAV